MDRFNSYLRSSEIHYRLASGTFWSLVGTALSKGVTLLGFIFVARILGVDRFGGLGIIQSTVGMFSVFAVFGMSVTATKYISEYRESKPERAGRILLLTNCVALAAGSLMSVILYMLSPLLAETVLAAPHLSDVLEISGLLLLFGSWAGAQTAALLGFEEFKRVAIINFVVAVLNLIFLISGAHWAGLSGAVWGLVAGMIVNVVINYFSLRVVCRQFEILPKWAGAFKEWRVLWRFSFPAVLAGAMVMPINWICSVLLVNQPNGYVQMGIFNAANQWFGALLFLPSMLSQVALPMLSEEGSEQNHERKRTILMLTIRWGLIVILPIILIISLTSPLIMSAYGPEFESGWLVLVAALITAGIMAGQKPIENAIAASDKMWIHLAMNFGWGVAYLVLTLFMVGWGALGVAIARGVAYLLRGVWAFRFAFKYMRLD